MSEPTKAADVLQAILCQPAGEAIAAPGQDPIPAARAEYHRQLQAAVEQFVETNNGLSRTFLEALNPFLAVHPTSQKEMYERVQVPTARIRRHYIDAMLLATIQMADQAREAWLDYAAAVAKSTDVTLTKTVTSSPSSQQAVENKVGGPDVDG